MQPSQSKSPFVLSVQAAKSAWNRTFRAARSPATEPIVPRSGSLVLLLLVAVAGVTISFIHYDDDVSRLAQNTWRNSAVLGPFFYWLTDLGTSGWILVSTGVVALYISTKNLMLKTRSNRVWWANLHSDLTFTFFTVAITGVLASLIKNSIGRARPKHLEQFGHLEFDFLAFESSYASFPSGHSTTFGAFCMALALMLPANLRPLWFVLALLGGISRVMVGAHYLSDVIVGLLFGAVLTALAARWLAQRGTMFRMNSNWLPERKNPVI